MHLVGSCAFRRRATLVSPNNQVAGCKANKRAARLNEQSALFAKRALVRKAKYSKFISRIFVQETTSISPPCKLGARNHNAIKLDYLSAAATAAFVSPSSLMSSKLRGRRLAKQELLTFDRTSRAYTSYTYPFPSWLRPTQLPKLVPLSAATAGNSTQAAI